MPAEKDGQAEIFLEYVNQHYQDFVTYAINLTRNKELAKELVGESILKCYEAINRKGNIQNDFSLYLIAQIRWAYSAYHKANKRIKLPLSDHLHVADSGLCHNAVDALALKIDVYITAHFPDRHVSWWQLHLKGVTYEEISFMDNVAASTVFKILKKMKLEVRELFKNDTLDLRKD